jgi:hypothetical protein
MKHVGHIAIGVKKNIGKGVNWLSNMKHVRHISHWREQTLENELGAESSHYFWLLDHCSTESELRRSRARQA